MIICIGSDHAGYEMKAFLTRKLKEWGHTVKDYGTDSPDSVDYPDFAHPVATEVAKNRRVRFGVLICGSANGVAMTANKHEKIRAAITWTKEMATLARQHNNANIICIPARYVNNRTASSMLKTFLETDFEGGRHKRRVGKIACS
ncbi:MAG: ribose 5-phosphate isomerase B [Bacteroidia bacterium]|nr:ribose 5-phosphate isomerase B [Bacteroidia bacterium]MBT8230369.1 ribose 5-phosphate isomerase B [Bacteroidia bacterium]